MPDLQTQTSTIAAGTGFGAYTTSPGAPGPTRKAAITGIRISDTRDALALSFETGESQSLPATYLWQECRSAAGIMRRLSGEAANPPAGLTILHLAPVGDYAINIVFSDGHRRGIFPWGFLQELAALRSRS